MARSRSPSPKRVKRDDLSGCTGEGEDSEEPQTVPIYQYKRGYDWFRAIGSPKYICAPMVDQSELPFRLLCKQYGTDLCYTPMLHSRNFSTQATYRANNFETCPEEGPVVAQFCGDDPETVLKAARYVEDQVAAVDLNLGCPQGIAKKGHYGSFLLSEPDLVISILSSLRKNLKKCAVTAKIRILTGDDEEWTQTFRLARRMEQEAGVDLITLHPRTKEMKGQNTGPCFWEAAAALKKHITSIPIVCNGGISSLDDANKCLKATSCDAVMSSEALLENPALFSGKLVPQAQLAEEYLELRDRFPATADGKCVKSHLFRFFYSGFQRNTDLRNRLGPCRKVEEMEEVVREYKEWREEEKREFPENPERGWYFRYRKDEMPKNDQF